MDPILLVYFTGGLRGGRALDLGTGCGLIPMILACRGDVGEAVGIEIQPEMAEMANRSVRINGLEARVRILQGDFRKIKEIFPPQSFQHVLSNPPYHDPGQGRTSPHKARALSRQEEEGSLKDVVRAARYALSTKGRLWLSYPPSRLGHLLRTLEEEGFAPRTLRFVHGRAELPARMSLVEAVRGGRGGLRVLAPLILYRQGRDYSEELEQIYRMI
jgi:tRNA1Val (adenine37-N6)-methyltransferase